MEEEREEDGALDEEHPRREARRVAVLDEEQPRALSNEAEELNHLELRD